MLEPLIVLTVLNCFFMFSSTVTTCALWWQYRTHRCCFKDTTQQSTRHNLAKSRSNNPSKKPVHSKQDNLGNPINRSKSNSTVNRENRNKKNPRQKSRSIVKNQLQNKALSDEGLSLIEIIGTEELEDKMRMSEASQTTNDTKSAVVMEYSTVQKIVQILDNDTDLVATKMVMKDLNNKQNLEEKKEPMIELQFEPQIISEFVSISEEQNN